MPYSVAAIYEYNILTVITHTLYNIYFYLIYSLIHFRLISLLILSYFPPSFPPQGLVSVTTSKRWKKLEPELRDIASSFRVYPLNSGVFTSEDYTKTTAAPVPVASTTTP